MYVQEVFSIFTVTRFIEMDKPSRTNSTKGPKGAEIDIEIYRKNERQAKTGLKGRRLVLILDGNSEHVAHA